MDFEDEVGDIPTRPMRVKILYTFDQDSKTNCLARFPEVQDVPAIAIDEGTQVGVIELKQCLQAIVAASPELISQLSDGDFTIYAYDYSETDTPLVGQGMLSAALAAATPSQQGSTMITGRVCKNMLALFSNGVKEMLEVKLRLVPVPRPAASDLTRSLDNFRVMTPAVSSGFDPNAWNASVQQTKSQTQINDYFNFDAISSGSDRDLALVDDIFGLASTSSGSGSGQQMAGGVGIAETPSDPSFAFNPAFSHSAPGSRAGSPIIGPEPSIRNEALRHQSFSGNASNFITDQSRPGSRASVRSEGQSPTHQRQASAPSLHHPAVQQQTELYYNEDGLPRKRARVTQTDWQGRSSFGSRSADLRVNAATAASVHMHRPIPKRPSAPGSNLEPPPRVPTPVPQRTTMLSRQQTQPIPRQSFLRQASTADSDFLSDIDNFSDAIMSSPEEESPGNSITAEGTPQEIPSSPPVFQGINQPQPSSPGLPTLPPPRLADSGYMSERGFNSGNILDSLENDEDRSPDAQDYEIASQYRSRRQQSQPFIKIEDGSASVMAPPMYLNDLPRSDMNIELEIPGDMNQLPSKMLLDLPPQRREGSQGPSKVAKPAPAKPATKPAASPYDGSGTTPGSAQTPSEQTHSRRNSLALPPRPSGPSSDLPDVGATSRPVPKKRQSLQRTRTSSNESEAGSPAPSDTEGRPKGPNRSGSGAHRRKIIEQRLQNSIAKGEMPQFCCHCGAIETPTWRRLYIKECEGKPSPLDEAEGEGETIGVEVTETDEATGEAIKFLIRKSMKKTKDNVPGPGFEDAVVCNPCGLWFNKFRTMRPQNKWGGKSGTRNRKKKDPEYGPGILTDGMEPPSDMFFTDQLAPEDSFEGAEGDEASGQIEGSNGETMPPPTGRPRANSMQAQRRRGSGQGSWKASQLDAALARAVQSSPVRFQGSQASPIEIDDRTPKPTRRKLFPSPRRDGEVRTLDDNGQVSLRSMSPHEVGGISLKSPKPGMELNFDQTNTNIFEAFTFDKENILPPLNEGEDGLAYLFEGSPSAIFRTPRKTPLKPTPKSNRNLMHTPTLSSRKRKPLSPNPNAANTVNDFMTSPGSARYWLRSTPSRLERTPGRLSQRGDDVSPWSRHLAQMLSDAHDGTAFTSPSRQFDFSDLPTFNTPGRMMADGDWEGLDGLLSSEFAAYEDGTRGEGGSSERVDSERV